MTRKPDPRAAAVRQLHAYASAGHIPLEVLLEIQQAIENGAELPHRPTIVAAMARALFVEAWYLRETYRKEDTGRSRLDRIPQGGNLMDYAPKTSPAARKIAKVFAAKLETTAGLPLPVLYLLAAHAPGRHTREPTPEDFGHDLAMEGMGHGVSWEDDHPKIPGPAFKIPYVEFYY
jgi:hypothetical protein